MAEEVEEALRLPVRLVVVVVAAVAVTALYRQFPDHLLHMAVAAVVGPTQCLRLAE
jgi:hypothetical protein